MPAVLCSNPPLPAPTPVSSSAGPPILLLCGRTVQSSAHTLDRLFALDRPHAPAERAALWECLVLDANCCKAGRRIARHLRQCRGQSISGISRHLAVRGGRQLTRYTSHMTSRCITHHA
eukprot:353376-Chlamydomonas_euryale.AAC.2